MIHNRSLFKESCSSEQKQDNCPICLVPLSELQDDGTIAKIFTHAGKHPMHENCCKELAINAKLLCPVCRDECEIDASLLAKNEAERINMLQKCYLGDNNNYPPIIIASLVVSSVAAILAPYNSSTAWVSQIICGTSLLFLARQSCAALQFDLGDVLTNYENNPYETS